MRLTKAQKVMVPVVMTFETAPRLAGMMPKLLAEAAKPGDAVIFEDGTPDDVLKTITIFDGPKDD